jgi:hypothetical protein
MSSQLSSMLMILLLSMAVSMSIALLLERVAYRPLRNAPRLVPLITAIGASFFLQYTFRGLYGSGFQAYPIPEVLQGHPGRPIRVFYTQIVAIWRLMMIILHTIVQRTKMGKAMRLSPKTRSGCDDGHQCTAPLHLLRIGRTFVMRLAFSCAALSVVNFMGFFPVSRPSPPRCWVVLAMWRKRLGAMSSAYSNQSDQTSSWMGWEFPLHPN